MPMEIVISQEQVIEIEHIELHELIQISRSIVTCRASLTGFYNAPKISKGNEITHSLR